MGNPNASVLLPFTNEMNNYSVLTLSRLFFAPSFFSSFVVVVVPSYFIVEERPNKKKIQNTQFVPSKLFRVIVIKSNVMEIKSSLLFSTPSRSYLIHHV